MKRALAIGFSALVLTSSVLFAQTPGPTSGAGTRSEIITEIVTGGVRAADKGLPRPFQSRLSGFQGELAAYLLTLHAEREAYRTLLEAMEVRVDKQVGSAPNSSGSTSLTTKGTVPEILGAAVEAGAFEEDVRGTTLTFRAKPAGIVKFLQGKGLLDIYHDYGTSAAARFAAKFSGAVSFDTSRGSSSGTFTADKDQFSSWSVRYEVVNHRDAALSQYAASWKELLGREGPYTKAVASITAALSNWPAFSSWRDQLIAEVDEKVEKPFLANHDTARAAAQFKTVLENGLPKLEKLSSPPAEVTAALDEYAAQLRTIVKGIDDVYTFANKGSLLTLDWSTTRDPKLPDLYTVTGVWEIGLGASRKADFTVNGAVSYYRSRPQGTLQQLKSVELSAQLDHPLGNILTLPAATLTIAARYTYLPHDTVSATRASVMGASPLSSMTPKGSIGLLQVKLTIPVKGSGVKIPLSITLANRTEAIKESIVRANFGLTFDLDTLLSAGMAGR